jgi:hypothetical protein
MGKHTMTEQEMDTFMKDLCKTTDELVVANGLLILLSKACDDYIAALHRDSTPMELLHYEDKLKAIMNQVKGALA